MPLDRIEQAAARLRDDANSLPAEWLIEIDSVRPMHEQHLGHPVFLHGVADILENHAALTRATGADPAPEAIAVAEVVLGGR